MESSGFSQKPRRECRMEKEEQRYIRRDASRPYRKRSSEPKDSLCWGVLALGDPEMNCTDY
ncbi:hypothetical protein GN958_ATG23247 [Phytophthora infestans]|nr:hypothetical protein GN958_ATG23247 [Phytophthora infestans]